MSFSSVAPARSMPGFISNTWTPNSCKPAVVISSNVAVCAVRWGVCKTGWGNAHGDAERYLVHAVIAPINSSCNSVCKNLSMHVQRSMQLVIQYAMPPKHSAPAGTVYREAQRVRTWAHAYTAALLPQPRGPESSRPPTPGLGRVQLRSNSLSSESAFQLLMAFESVLQEFLARFRGSSKPGQCLFQLGSIVA